MLLLFLFLLIQVPAFNSLGHFIADSGKEIMVPLELLKGKELYRDVFWLYGPWAPYFNAFAYKLLGIHLDTLLWVAKLLGAGVIASIYRLLRNFSSPLVSFFGAFSVLTFSTTSSFFAWPYSFSNLWATLLALISVDAMTRWLKTGSTWQITLSALAAILVASSKFIIALPLLTALWCCALALKHQQLLDRTRLKHLIGFTATLIGCFMTVTWYFALKTDPTSYRLQLGAVFHAKHIMAAGLYDRLLETVFLKNGLGPENISAAISILLCPLCVLTSFTAFGYLRYKNNLPSERWLPLIPLAIFAAGNLLQINSSVHAPYVFPASLAALFAFSSLSGLTSNKVWRMILVVICLYCSLLGSLRLAKLRSYTYPVNTPTFHFNWSNDHGRQLQNIAQFIQEHTKPEDKIIIFSPHDYMYLAVNREPAANYFYTWYEPFHEAQAAARVCRALESDQTKIAITHLEEPFSLAFASPVRNHPVYQKLRENFHPIISKDKTGNFIIWVKQTAGENN